MNVVESNGLINVYQGGVELHRELPPDDYKIVKDMSGLHLKRYHGMKQDTQVYGHRLEQVDRIYKMYNHVDHSIGVILAGDKGIGKTLFSRLLASRAHEQNMPVIIIDVDYEGLASYLMDIDQPCLVLFDEFEKVFDSRNQSGQSELLPLFDGLSSAKHINVVTTNEMNSLSAYMINRPGRFHYNIQFDYPTPEEITLYMKDNIPESSYSEIENIIDLARKFPLNYDYLRAISEEITVFGCSLKEAVKDMNIIPDRILSLFEYDVYLKDGSIKRYYKRDNVFDNDHIGFNYEVNDNDYDDCFVSVKIKDLEYNRHNGVFTLEDMSKVQSDMSAEDKGKIKKITMQSVTKKDNMSTRI
jgi:hypothetical protein